MSVIGIDIGTSYCVLATIQRGAVTIVRNDLSERLTPALIGFTDKERHIGEAAQTHIKSNYRNTCRYIKQLLGLTRADQKDVDMERCHALAPLDFADNTEGALAGFNVCYRGKQQVFTATRCLAALLTKLKDTAERSIGTPVQDVVISVPAWYSDRARQAILDAAQIARLNCLRAMNEHAAVALDYGIYRSSTFDAEKASRVVFVGVGHGSTTVSVVDFTRGQLRVQAVATDKNFGGRDLDAVIMRHFAAQFQKQFGVDPLQHSKAVLKLEDAATRIKKILSANSEAPLSIECLVDDFDLSGMLSRQEFESLCLPYKQRLLDVLNTAFAGNGLNPDDIHSIEIVGGCCRTPWIQETISEFFNHRLPLSRTLNMDETVARGCALQAAMLDPRYRVREFNVVDCLFDPVSVAYLSSSGSGEPELKSSVLFETGSALGMRKWLTFVRSSNFDVQLTPGRLGHPLVSHILIPPEGLALEWPKRVKLGAKLTLHGTVMWEAAQLLVDEQVEEVVTEKRPVTKQPASGETAEAPLSPTMPAGGEQPSEVGAAPQMQGTTPSADAAAFEEVPVTKTKTKTRRFDCQITSEPRIGYLEPHVKATLCNEESEMIANDLNQRLIRETMNDLETYIYKMQSLLTDGLKDFASEEERQRALSALEHAQDWLYDTPDGTRECYDGKMKELQALCEPPAQRQREYGERQDAIQEMFQVLAELRASETSPEWSHIEPEKMRSLSTKISESSNWLEHVSKALQKQALWENASVTAATIRQEKEMLVNFSKTILVPKATESSAKHSEESAGDKDAASTQETDLHDANMSSPEQPSATESSDVPMT